MLDSRESYPKALIDLMARHFNLEEVRTLCFELGIAYDDLVGEGLRGKLRELILHVGRRNLLDDLFALLRRERPVVDWPAAPLPTLPAADPTRRGDSYVIGPSNNSYLVVGPGASMVIGERSEHPPDTPS